MEAPSEYNTSGYIPDPDSDKDWIFGESKSTPVAKHTGDVDLRPFSVSRHNQQSTGSCVAQCVVKAMEIGNCIENGVEAHRDYSTLFVYWLARSYMNPPRTKEDSGTHIRNACEAAKRLGVCQETAWPFSLARVPWKPSWVAMKDAHQGRVDSFYRIKGLGNKRVKRVIEALQAECPVVFGCPVDHQWHAYRNLGDESTPRVLGVSELGQGRHATTIVGYKDGMFIGENSWGDSWGYKGFYYLDPAVIASPNTRDIWALKTTTQKP